MNTLLLLVLLHLIGLYLFKPKNNSLYCGIFGYLGSSPKFFKQMSFDVLGLYNDSRGKDSCGIFKNRSVQYGAGDQKLYEKCVQTNFFKNESNKDNVVLGHCRKASVGGISLETAQPVVIYNENNEPIFVMIHNGTLINYKELADKYGVTYTATETDSQIFARIVFKQGFDVLGEYTGAGAFVFYNIIENRVFMFKGESLANQWSKEVSEERPLFLSFNKKSKYIWFSSICDSLKFIEPKEEVYTLSANTLYTIINGEIVDRRSIDRKDKYQTETKTAYHGNNWGNNYSGYKSSTSKKINDRFAYYSNAEEEIVQKTKDHIVYARGRYYYDGQLCNGLYTMNYEGRFDLEHSPYDFAFCDGILLEKNTDLTECLAAIKDFDQSIPDEDFGRFATIIEYACKDHTYCYHPDGRWYFMSSLASDKENPFKYRTYGNVEPLFSNAKIQILKDDAGYCIVYNSEMKRLKAEETLAKNNKN